MPTLTISVPMDRSYSLMKCIRKNFIECINIYEEKDEFQVRFVLRKMERTKLGKAILMQRLKKYCC